MESLYKTKKYIPIAEAGRGFAAFYVFIFHLIKFTELRESLTPNTFLYYLMESLGGYGHQAVLFFFLLSGFSIHYSSMDRSLGNIKGVIKFYYSRIRRIYPIYIIAILITLLLLFISANYYPSYFNEEIEDTSLNIVIYNLLFLSDRHYVEGILASALPTNAPLWSLSYEVLYYFLYPLFWYISVRYGKMITLTGTVLISSICILYANLHAHNHLVNVLSLYVIWSFGAYVAQMYREGKYHKTIKPYYLLLAIYILSQSVWVLEGATYTLGSFYEVLWGLLFFVCMTYFVVAKDEFFTQSNKLLLVILFIISAAFIDIVSLYIDLANDMTYFYIKIHTTLIVFILMATFNRMNFKKLLNLILSPFENIGKYSYALYILHYPILYTAYKILEIYQLSLLFLVLLIFPILAISKFLEGKYQLKASQFMDRIFYPKKA